MPHLRPAGETHSAYANVIRRVPIRWVYIVDIRKILEGKLRTLRFRPMTSFMFRLTVFRMEHHGAQDHADSPVYQHAPARSVISGYINYANN